MSELIIIVSPRWNICSFWNQMQVPSFSVFIYLCLDKSLIAEVKPFAKNHRFFFTFYYLFYHYKQFLSISKKFKFDLHDFIPILEIHEVLQLKFACFHFCCGFFILFYHFIFIFYAYLIFVNISRIFSIFSFLQN